MKLRHYRINLMDRENNILHTIEIYEMNRYYAKCKANIFLANTKIKDAHKFEIINLQSN